MGDDGVVQTTSSAKDSCLETPVVKLGNAPFSAANSGEGFGMRVFVVTALTFGRVDLQALLNSKIVFKVGERLRPEAY